MPKINQVPAAKLLEPFISILELLDCAYSICSAPEVKLMATRSEFLAMLRDGKYKIAFAVGFVVTLIIVSTMTLLFLSKTLYCLGIDKLFVCVDASAIVPKLFSKASFHTLRRNAEPIRI